MHRSDLTVIEYREVAYYETEAVYKCPNCEEGQIIRWKETEPGYRCSGWYVCEKCGFDPNKNIEG